MEWGPDRGFGPFPPEKIVNKKLDMVNHPLVDWCVFSEYNDTILEDYKVASWAVNRLMMLELKKWIPGRSEPLAPGSKSRVLEKKGDDWYWEGEIIDYKNVIK